MSKQKPAPSAALARRDVTVIAAIAILQFLCMAVFLEELILSVFGYRTQPLDWSLRTAVEALAAFGLILGGVLGALLIRVANRERRRAENTLRAASGDFQALVQEDFNAWGLTPSEQDVALFMLKGFANSEIAALRQTSEGTIKAQTTAVFRKAGVSGRPQLLSHFIEELLADDSEDDSAGRGAADRP